MANETEDGLTVQRRNRLANAGISADMLKNAADSAARLCDQSGAADGSPLAPCHFADYQQLFRELAAKAKS